MTFMQYESRSVPKYKLATQKAFNGTNLNDTTLFSLLNNTDVSNHSLKNGK